jgi:hypothetical protein
MKIGDSEKSLRIYWTQGSEFTLCLGSGSTRAASNMIVREQNQICANMQFMWKCSAGRKPCHFQGNPISR